MQVTPNFGTNNLQPISFNLNFGSTKIVPTFSIAFSTFFNNVTVNVVKKTLENHSNVAFIYFYVQGF